MADRARILAGDTAVRVTFTQPYPVEPIVTLTLMTDAALERYLVTGVERTGFTIKVSPASHDGDIDFSWLALLAPGGRIHLSDGSVEEHALAASNTATAPALLGGNRRRAFRTGTGFPQREREERPPLPSLFFSIHSCPQFGQPSCNNPIKRGSLS